jgi:hypothetical protein
LSPRCFLPIHGYDTASSRPVAVLLRPVRLENLLRDIQIDRANL